MAAVDLLVLLVALLVGLALGGVLAWASLLLRTGHPPRPQPGEWRGMPSPRGAPSSAGPGEPGASAAFLGSIVVLLAAAVVAALVVPIPTAIPLSRLPGGALTVGVAALVVALVYAVPAWRGARR